MLLSIVAGARPDLPAPRRRGIGVPGWASIMVSIWFLGRPDRSSASASSASISPRCSPKPSIGPTRSCAPSTAPTRTAAMTDGRTLLEHRVRGSTTRGSCGQHGATPRGRRLELRGVAGAAVPAAGASVGGRPDAELARLRVRLRRPRRLPARARSPRRVLPGSTSARR